MALLDPEPCPPLGDCQSFADGHQVHWIPARRSAQDRVWPGVPCQVTEYWENGVIVLDVGGAERRYWNHHPTRLWQMVNRNGGAVVIQGRRRLLRTKSEDGWYCFSLGDAATWAEEECVYWGEDGELYRQRTGSRTSVTRC